MKLIQLTHGLDTPLVLQGAGMAAPFRGAAFAPLGDPLGESRERYRNNWIDDVLELVLENNTPATISAGFSKLEYFLTLARDYTLTHVGSPVYLDCIGATGELNFRSPLLGGWIETAGGGRDQGSVGLKLHVFRECFWEQTTETQLKLAAPGGASSLAELSLYNHFDADAGHYNVFQALGADIAGDLPAPVRLEFRAITDASMKKIYFGEDLHPAGGAFLPPGGCDASFFSGVGGPVVDAACAYATKAAPSWAGSGESYLGYWAIAGADAAKAGGRYWKPVLRLPGGGTAYADLWLRLRVKDGLSSVIWEGPYSLIPAGQELVDLAPIPLPPNLVEVAAGYAGINIELLAKRIAGGACSLVFDYMQLMPTDIFLKAEAKNTGSGIAEYLMVDGLYHLMYASGNRVGQFHSDFAVYGDPAPVVIPGQLAQFHLLFQRTAAVSFITSVCGVKAFYHPRKRLL